MNFHEKFSIPFACIALGLLAIPLGLQSKTDKRSLGIMLGLVLFLAVLHASRGLGKMHGRIARAMLIGKS